MIEVVSYPPDLGTWNPGEEAFYLELYGETRPQINLKYAEVQPPGPTDGTPQSIAPAPIYQYWWTIAHDGNPHQLAELWQQLPDTAAHVYMYFPRSRGWRVKELVATVNYLSPVHEQAQWWNKVAEAWQKISPLASDVSSLAGLIPNPAFAGAATVLSTIAKLQVNSVPQVDGFQWSVEKIATRTVSDVVHGVMWTLPKKMFTELGGRLTGSIAVSFIPALIQQNNTAFSAKPHFQPGPILAHAVVYGPHGEIWIPPDQRKFVKLHIEPCAEEEVPVGQDHDQSAHTSHKSSSHAAHAGASTSSNSDTDSDTHR